MTINYTTNLGLGQPVTGTESGTWGDDVNNSITAYLDIAIGGTNNITTDADVTLTLTQGTNSATNISGTSAQYYVLNCTGSRSLLRNIFVPTAGGTVLSKTYVVINNTTGGFGITIKKSGGTGVTVASGETAIVYANPVAAVNDVVKVSSTVITNLTGILSAANGGTGVANNSASTITISGNYGTTFTVTGTTAVTLPTSGTLLTTTGSGSSLTFGTGSLSLAGNVTYSGSFTQTFTATANTSVTLPTSGYLISSATNMANNPVTGTPSSSNFLRGDGTWSTAGIATSSANTFTATQTFNGSTSTFAEVLLNAAETTTISATAATGTINFYINSQSVLYYTSNASANWTLNVAFSSGTSLNTAMSTGQAVTLAFLNTNGSTAYYASAFTIDGTSVTPKWQGGTAPNSGNASATDVYTYTIVKTSSATYTVLASQTKFA